MQATAAVCLKCCTRNLHSTGYCELCDEYTGLEFTSDRIEPVSMRIRSQLFKRMDATPRSGVTHTEFCVGPAACTALFHMYDVTHSYDRSTDAEDLWEEAEEDFCKFKFFRLHSFEAIQAFAR